MHSTSSSLESHVPIQFKMAAMLLRKVWESVSNTSSSKSNSRSSSFDRFRQMMYIQSSSTGAFDRIPVDIFMLILKFIGPKEAAKLSAVCKSWKFIVADNRLWISFLQNQQEPWDSTFFAETNLRSGYPLQYVSNFSSLDRLGGFDFIGLVKIIY